VAGWSKKKRRAFEAGFREFLNHVTINSKDYGKMILGKHLFDAQERFITCIFDGLEEGIHDFYILKSRQLGASTLTRAFSTFWLGMHDGLTGGIVFDTDFNKKSARREIENMIRDLPPDMKFPTVMAANREGVTLSNQSTILFWAAGVKVSKGSGTLGRSIGLSYSHGCLHPDTPVIVQDGRVKKIRDVVVGDTVVTHSGAIGRITANIAKANDRGPMRRITPWLGEGILCTTDHKIQTERGLIKAGDIVADDRITMPIRKITSEFLSSVLPCTKARVQGGGSISAAAGYDIAHNEETGFAIGYYLAEGCMVYQRRGVDYYQYPSGLVFTRHRSEVGYADRAIDALEPFTTSHRKTKDNPNNLTSTEHIYGSALATWIRDTFGAQDNKIIPDDIFRWGEDFCRGLVSGLLCGDGSKTDARLSGLAGDYLINKVSLSSTRSSVATQLRDLVASLGYGWGSIRHRRAGQFYGRNCKEIWTVTWNGRAAYNLRKLMGLSVVEPKQIHSEKYEVRDDRVKIRIRKIEDGIDQPFMHDLSVDHSDHTFRTPSMAVSNSEICSWANPEGLEAYRKSLSQIHPNRLYIWESTARGYNDWYDMWLEAKDDPGKKCLFLGWWSKPNQKINKNTVDFRRYGVQPPTPKEEEKIIQVREDYGHQITPEQLAWIRKDSDPTAIAEEGSEVVEYEPDAIRLQENPWTEADAFQFSGDNFFAPEPMKEQSDNWVRNPIKTYSFATYAEFIDTRIHPTSSERQTQLRIWEDPEPGDAIYVVSADPAYGSSDRSDRSAMQVLRCYADGCDQVAEYAWPLTGTRQFAWAILAVAGFYATNNDVRLIIELNGPGRAVWDEIVQVKRHIASGYQPREIDDLGIRRVFANVRNYVYTRNDSLDAGRAWQWTTSPGIGPASKVRLMERMRDAVSTGKVHIRSHELLDEMKGVKRKEDEIGAEGRQKDDRVVAMAMAIHCWDDRVIPQMSARKRTREFEANRRKLTIADMSSLYMKFQFDDMLKRKTIDRKAMLRAHRMKMRGYR